jgi:hypothetical protein
MKSIVPIELALLSLIFISTCPPAKPPDSSTLGVFVATSPCNEVSRRLLQIPTTANCEMIKWNLTLYQDANTLTPTTYTLNCVYGLPQQGTNGLSNGGTKVDREGRWTMVRGTKANPDAIIYELDPGDSQGPESFLKVDHNLLHLLNRDESLAIGIAGWSYTLNRTENIGRDVQQATAPTTSPLQVTSPTTAGWRKMTASSIVGRFEGRSPCLEVARELNKDVDADCIKVKWDLTLYQDPSTTTPTRYKLNGTFYRERVREGKWAILLGTKIGPAAVVYQLDPDKPQSSLLFLKADDNVLFFLDRSRNLMIGNGDFSYTLNRAR